MSKQSEPCSDDAALSAPNAVPAWSGNQTNNGYAFVTSTGVLCVAKAVDGNVGADASDELRKTTGDAKPVTLRDTGKAEKTTPAADPVAAARTSLATVQAGLAAGLGNHHVEKNSDDFANQNKSPKEHPPAPKYGGSFDTDVPCLGCGALGVDGSFLLCNGCPAGGHLDCLGMRCAPLGNRWECDSCEGGRLAGIRPPGTYGDGFPKSRHTVLPELVTVVHTSRYSRLTLFVHNKRKAGIRTRRRRRRARRENRYVFLPFPNQKPLVRSHTRPAKGASPPRIARP
jgi:hypothetical protein